MVIDARSAADEIGAAFETGRRELAKVDLEKVRDDAVSAARSALPALHMPSRQKRRRWPLVAAILALTGAAMGWVLLPGIKARVTAAIADRRRLMAEPDPDGASTLDAEMAPEMRPFPREMAGSPA